jgi:hypothetical protein
MADANVRGLQSNLTTVKTATHFPASMACPTGERATVFSRPTYAQGIITRTADGDVHKTAFRTRYGHFDLRCYLLT